MLVKTVIFITASIPILIVSRKSLLHPKTHGFYRFIAWEIMAAMVARVLLDWFSNPLRWNQIISWFLLVICLIPLGFGFYTLIKRGKPNKEMEDDRHLISFEKTTRLVNTGIYKYIRHPLYSSLFLLTWGLFFKMPSILLGFMALIATLFIILTAKTDEKECVRFFGSSYEEYMKQTKMFIPLIF